MAGRKQIRDVVQETDGDVTANAEIWVFKDDGLVNTSVYPPTGTAVRGSIFPDDSSGGAVTNPVDTTDANGNFEFWMQFNQRVKVVVFNAAHVFQRSATYGDDLAGVRVGDTQTDMRLYSDLLLSPSNWSPPITQALVDADSVYVPSGVWGVASEILVGKHKRLYSDGVAYGGAESSGPTLGAILQATAAMRSVVRLGTVNSGDASAGVFENVVADGNQLATSALEIGNDDATAADNATLIHFKAMNGLSFGLLWRSNQGRIKGGWVRQNVNVADPGIAFWQEGADIECANLTINGGKIAAAIHGDEGVYSGSCHWTASSIAGGTANVMMDTVSRTQLLGVIMDTASSTATAHLYMLNCNACEVLGMLISAQYNLAAAVFPAVRIESNGPTCQNNNIDDFRIVRNGTVFAGWTHAFQLVGGTNKINGNKIGSGHISSSAVIPDLYDTTQKSFEWYGQITQPNLAGDATLFRKKYGRNAFVGDGATKVFVIPHKLMTTPNVFDADPDGAGQHLASLTADATNLTATFAFAPAAAQAFSIPWKAECV